MRIWVCLFSLLLCFYIWVGGCGGTESPEPVQEVSTQESSGSETQADTDASTGGGGDSQTPTPIPDKQPDTTVQDDGRPARICKVPKSPGSGPYFRDISKEMGLGDGALQAFGNRLSSVDLDGDGYPDLIVHSTGNHERDEPGASPPKRYRWILMNRPHPDDPKRRTFVDMTENSGYIAQDDGKPGRVSHFSIYADINNDGQVDMFSGVYVDPTAPDKDSKDRSRILLGEGQGKFRLQPKTAGVAPPNDALWTTTSATFLDFDRDGKIDVFVGFWYSAYGQSYESFQDRLYKGNGDGTFTDVTDQVGLKTKSFAEGYKDGTNHRPTYGVTSCDLDGDGNTDLVISAYGRQYNMVYLNRKGRFEHVPSKDAVDGDTLRDFKDNEFYKCFCKARPGSCPAGVPAPLVQCPATPPWNVGYDDHPFRLNGNTFSTVCGDINNDGKMDLFHTEIRHWHIGSSSDPTQLLLNISSGGNLAMRRIDNVSAGMERPKVGSWNQGDIMAAFFDFDQDGRPDIYLCSSDYPDTFGSLFRQLSSSTIEEPKFADISKAAGVAHPRALGLVVADVDGDGDLDLIVGSSRMRCSANEGCPWKKAEIHVYENLIGQDSNWVRIRLRGKGAGGANRMGIGARIRVTAGGVTQTQEISGGYGHFGLQNGLYAHFGLGAQCDIEKIEIRWPNGENTVQTFENARANYEITIEEGNSTLTYRALGQ